MPFRTLAHKEVGNSELKIWIVTERRLDNPREFIAGVWAGAVENTSTFLDSSPDSFEFNEPVPDEPHAPRGQAIYRTDHGLYSYDFEEGAWVRTGFQPEVKVVY